MTAKERARAKKFLKMVVAAKKKIAEGRDELRDAMEECEAILDSSERAEESLTEAVDALSEYL